MDEMEDWAFAILEALNANQQLDMLHALGPKYGLDPEHGHAQHARAAELADAEQPAVHAHRDAEPARLGLDHRAHRGAVAQGWA